jgi:hypothetical protein
MISFFHGTSRDPVLHSFACCLEARMPKDSHIIMHWDTTVQVPRDSDLCHHTLDDNRIVSIWSHESIGPCGGLYGRHVIAAPRPLHIYLEQATDSLQEEIARAKVDLAEMTQENVAMEEEIIRSIWGTSP